MTGCPCLNTESDASMKFTNFRVQRCFGIVFIQFDFFEQSLLYFVQWGRLPCEGPNYRISGGVDMSVFRCGFHCGVMKWF